MKIEDIIEIVLSEDPDLAPLEKQKRDRITEKLFRVFTDLEIKGNLKL